MYDKKKAIIYTLLKSFQVEFFGFFVMIFFWAVAQFLGVFGNIMFGFTGLMCVVCIMADFAMKQGTLAKDKMKYHGDEVSQNFGLIIGAVSMAPSYVTMIFLVLSKYGVIGNFLPAYKVLNASYYPFIDLAAHSAFIDNMSPLVFIMTALFPLLYLISSWIGFRITFNQVDVKEQVVYKH